MRHIVNESSRLNLWNVLVLTINLHGHAKHASQSAAEASELLLVYVDDVLACSHDPKSIMESIGTEYVLKDGYDIPKIYLGANIAKVHFRMLT